MKIRRHQAIIQFVYSVTAYDKSVSSHNPCHVGISVNTNCRIPFHYFVNKIQPTCESLSAVSSIAHIPPVPVPVPQFTNVHCATANNSIQFTAFGRTLENYPSKVSPLNCRRGCHLYHHRAPPTQGLRRLLLFRPFSIAEYSF